MNKNKYFLINKKKLSNGRDKGYIYAITYIPFLFVYIGQSVVPYARIRQHIRMLEAGKHHCRKLQICYNEVLEKSMKSSKKHFHFDIIEECDIENLDEREQFYINENIDKILNTKIDVCTNKNIKPKRQTHVRLELDIPVHLYSELQEISERFGYNMDDIVHQSLREYAIWEEHPTSHHVREKVEFLWEKTFEFKDFEFSESNRLYEEEKRKLDEGEYNPHDFWNLMEKSQATKLRRRYVPRQAKMHKIIELTKEVKKLCNEIIDENKLLREEYNIDER